MNLADFQHRYAKNNLSAHGNLNIWLGSLGFATVIKLEPVVELEELPVEFEGCMIFTDSSSSSPSILGRRRAAIRTLADAMVAMVREQRAAADDEQWFPFVTGHVQ